MDLRSGRVVIPFPSRADGEELRAAYDRYRAVTGTAAPDTLCTPDVVQARLALTRLLIADGWEAPRAVLEQLSRDTQQQVRPRAS
jgi:ribose 1,5-bisphosphokinase PhnN